MNLTKLAELRRAATPGPWNLRGPLVKARDDRGPFTIVSTTDLDGSEADAAFIAAAGSIPPETWEALARVVEAARDVQHEWDQLGPTGDANTLAAHRALREALAALEAAPE